jgi:hypothetical protein
MYFMALLFWLFGASVEVARVASGVIHGLAGVLLLAACRSLGARRSLAWLPALAYLVICQAAWPIASQHWLSTLLAILILWLSAQVLRDRGRWAPLLGVALGLSISVHQPRGVITLVGAVLWLALDHVLEHRHSAGRAMRSLFATLARVAAGMGVVLVPLFGWLVARAGFFRVWRALVLFPFYDYAGITHCAWGDVNVVSAWQASFTFPLLLKFLPVFLIPSALRLAWAVAAGRSPFEARGLLLLLVTAATSIVSIQYFPDFVHIAFIAPVFFVAITENLEWALRSVAAPRALTRAVGWIAAATAVVACAVRLNDNLVRLREAYPFRRSTSFGRVDLRNEKEALLYDEVEKLMSSADSSYLYCYPVMSHLYLMLGVDNPTGHGFFSPELSGPDLTREVLESLAAKRPPYIVFIAGFVKPGDPVAAWITEHYEPVGGESDVAPLIFRPK